MKQYIAFISIIICVSLQAFHLDNIGSTHHQPSMVAHLPVQNFFQPKPLQLKKYTIITDPLCLQQAAKDTLLYFAHHQTGFDHFINPVGFKDVLPLEKVKETLHFLIDTIEEDKAHGVFRIHDPIFLKHHFGFLTWKADWKQAEKNNVDMPHDGQIRLTSYGILAIKGNTKKTASYPCGLYQLVDRSIQKKYTKQQILAGILEKEESRKKRIPLAWVCRQDLEDALMHGTILVTFGDHTCKVLNVDRSNGIAYNPKQKNILSQKRYWFFREIKKKPGINTIDRFKKRKNVIFAGDLYHLGIGKIIAIMHPSPKTARPELMLGILADTGGAFENNLYQLDLFGGVFENRFALKRYLQTMPCATQACILYKK